MAEKNENCQETSGGRNMKVYMHLIKFWNEF